MQYWQAGVVSTVSSLLREHMQPIVVSDEEPISPPAEESAPTPQPAAEEIAPTPIAPTPPPPESDSDEQPNKRRRIRGKQASAHA